MRLLVVGALVTAVVCLGAGPASAHASLVSASPADGAVLTRAPRQVKLEFNENIRAPSKIVVTGPSGRVSHGATRVVDNTVSVDVDLRAEPTFVGRYDFVYRVISADGHPVAAQLRFDYRPPGVTAAPSTTARPTQHASQGRSVLWWVVGAAVVVVVAGLLFGGRSGRRRSRRRS